MKNSNGVKDYKLFKLHELISHKTAVDVIAPPLKLKNESIRATKDRVKKTIAYWVKCGKLRRHLGGFVSGELAWLVRQKYPDHFDGWLRIVDERIEEQLPLSSQILGVPMPADPFERELLIMKLHETKEDLERQLRQHVADAEKARIAKLQRVKWGKQGGRGRKK